MSGQAKGLSERVARALEDEFLRGAVKRTTGKLRTAKRAAEDELGNWEEWRERARQIRDHTIRHLDVYLEQFAKNARRAGAEVHFASTGKEATEIAWKIIRDKKANRVAKSKSMVSEEVDINRFLEDKGVEVVETDLGEYIIQLAGETPSHLIMPSIHKTREQVADVLSEVAGKPLPTDTESLAGVAREKLRETFLTADVGMTGCNFAIAETGSIVLFSNEGNARMVSTLPKTHIVMMGMERILPSLEDLEVMAHLLPRSATGQKLTVYLSVITGPKRKEDADGPEEMHIIIIDNGRSRLLGNPEFQEALHCIRCGACLNACPVYRHVGGHAYGWVYSGPIGAVITPLIHEDKERWSELANASSLCGACYEACPVKIPLHDMLVFLRRKNVEEDRVASGERWTMRAFGMAVANHKRFRLAISAGKWGQRLRLDRVRISPAHEWGRHREFPDVAEKSFRDRWADLEREMGRTGEEMSPKIRERLLKKLAERGGINENGNR
jgi:L-lactate dehydrogenase complex protein LldF